MSRGLKQTIVVIASAGLVLLLVWIWRVSTPLEQSPAAVAPAPPAPVRPAPAEPVPAAEMPAAEGGSEPAPPVPASSPANAADVYRRAFAMVEALTEAENRALYQWDRELDPAATAELCGKLKPISELALAAGGLTNCDWGLKQATFETPLPHLNQTRSLARALIWHAARCRAGDAAGIADDVEATLRLGQNTSQAIIGHLVSTAIEEMTINYVAASAGSWPGPVQTRVQRVFADKRYEQSVSRALESEAAMLERSAESYAAKLLADSPGTAPASPAQLQTALRQVAELEREYARLWNAPDADQQVWRGKVQAARQANPLLAGVWEGIDGAIERSRAAVVKRALVAAGLALLQNQPGALASHPDPATGEPFEYHQTDDGFGLHSAHQQFGKPLELAFPNR